MQEQQFHLSPAETMIEDIDEEPPSYTNPLMNALSYLPGTGGFGYSSIRISPNLAKTSEQPPRSLAAARAFRRRFFPNIADKEWKDWQWQIANRIRNYEQLKRIIRLSSEERGALENHHSHLPLGITPYYMSLIQADNPYQPIRRTVVPTIHELIKSDGEADDPLGEEHQSPIPGLVHRYPDRALLLVLDFCSTYCRYCTRSRVVGHGAIHPSRSRLEKAIDYIRHTPTIRDVLLSGGDPLTLGDEKLEWILKNLRTIPHIDIIRIGTKIPAVLPQRVSKKLTRMLKKYHPLWMSLHFAHPEECTEESYRACTMLSDAGIPLGSQTVLLRDINDNVATMKSLMHHLMKMRVRPYYLYQCDPISGSAHFRTRVEKGLEIIRGLRGFTSGYAVPTYVIDAPGGGGKVPLMPDYVAGRNGDQLVLRNYEDNLYAYPDPIIPKCMM